ncbi:YihY/virulence factor BrkB family protein [soil metagenome]
MTAKPIAMLRTARQLARDSLSSYSRHSGRMLASAVAFSALLSIAPLLFIALGIASIAVGSQLGVDSVHQDLTHWIGSAGADTIMSLLEHASERSRSVTANVGGGIVLVYASTRPFSQMKRALNHIWDVHAKSGTGWKGKVGKQLRKRGLSLMLVVFVGVLIIGSVGIKTVIVAADHQIGDSHRLFRVGESLVSLATTTVMFAALFKILPDAKLHWHDAWRGALVTSVLFSIGTTIIGLYLGHRALGAKYGPGGSLVLLLLWVHYSAQVFFLGASVTGELARRRGHPIEPDENGVRIMLGDSAI